MAETKRFEVRCESSLRDLVRVLRHYEGDSTVSALFRRLVLKRARELMIRNPNCEVARVFCAYESEGKACE